MKIYIVTYEDNTGFGYQKLFYTKKAANKWLFDKFRKDNDGECATLAEYKALLAEHKIYGAHSAKIKCFNVKHE